VVCFNRNAALELRRRLFDLVGADARGVQVQTYHGLAMRLTGHSYAARAEDGGDLSLDAVIPEAVRLLTRTLLEVGRYQDAIEAARRFEQRHPGDAGVANVLGEALWRTGDLDGAEQAFERAAAQGTLIGLPLIRLVTWLNQAGVAVP